VDQPDELALCSDEDLLTHFRTGQLEAFGILLRRYERELFGYLRRYLGDPSLAEDVFQNTFLQVYQKASQYQPGRAVRPWLYTIATHQAIDALRRAWRRQAVSIDTLREAGPNGDVRTLQNLMEAPGADPLERLEGDERRDQVRQAIEGLPEHLRGAVILAYYQGLKYREIAEILEVPVGTVKSRLHAALIRIHEALRTLEDLPKPNPQAGEA
jgi:RNA polymerase sigma-70 factor (ECF subfamily)